MKKVFKIKSVLSLMLVFALCLSITGFANSSDIYASDLESYSVDIEERWVMVFDDSIGQDVIQNTKTNEKIYDAFVLDENGNAINKDLKEYKDELNYGIINFKNQKPIIFDNKINEALNEEEKTDIGVYRLNPIWDEYTFKKMLELTVSGSSVKVTADVTGPAAISYGNTSTVTNSFSLAAGASLDLTAKIKASASFTWTTSTSTNTSFGITYNVPSGKIGYIKFTPYLMKVIGETYKETWASMLIDPIYQIYINMCIASAYIGLSEGYSPKKLSNGFADGVYALVLK